MRRAAGLVLGGGSGAGAVPSRFSAFGRTNRGRFDLTGHAFLAAGAGVCGGGVTATGSALPATGTGATSAGGVSGTGFGAAFLAGLRPWICSGSCTRIFLAARDRFKLTSGSSGSGDSHHLTPGV